MLLNPQRLQHQLPDNLRFPILYFGLPFYLIGLRANLFVFAFAPGTIKLIPFTFQVNTGYMRFDKLLNKSFLMRFIFTNVGLGLVFKIFEELMKQNMFGWIASQLGIWKLLSQYIQMPPLLFQ